MGAIEIGLIMFNTVNEGKLKGYFHAMKHIFGESVRATSKEGMLRKVTLKFNCYNIFVTMAQ